jgi:uncharacterized protein (TIGR02246 family)
VAVAVRCCDQCAVRDVAACFSDALNRGDSAAVAGLFTQDGQWTVPGFPVAAGHAAIQQQLAAVLSAHQHVLQFLHAGHVDFTTDGSAAATWYASENLVDLAGTQITMHGTYRDSLTRTAAGWRFTRREFTLLYRATERRKWYADPAVPE